MKFLVVSANPPDKNTLRNQYFKLIHDELNKKIKSKIIWVVLEPEKKYFFDDDFCKITYLTNYSNSLKLLKSLSPDFIIVDTGLETIQYSLSLSARYLNIPIISFSGAKIQSFSAVKKGSYHIFRRFFSSGVPTDTEKERKFMRRGKFMVFKYLFYVKTQTAIDRNFLKITSEFFKDLYQFLFNKPPRANLITDLVLLHYENQIELLKKFGFDENKLTMIGNPLLDKIQDNFQKFEPVKNNSKRIKILVVTDSLYEHGIWSYNQRNNFLNSLFSELSKYSEIDFSLKIHPSAEQRDFYINLLGKLNLNIKIFQSEELLKIISKFDLVISYGASTSHSEISFCGMKLILLDSTVDLIPFPLITEGVESGHVVKCTNISELYPMILKLKNKDLEISRDFIESKKKLFYKLDGKSTERAANAIVNLVNNIT
jgi:hypothetical protein